MSISGVRNTVLLGTVMTGGGYLYHYPEAIGKQLDTALVAVGEKIGKFVGSIFYSTAKEIPGSFADTMRSGIKEGLVAASKDLNAVKDAAFAELAKTVKEIAKEIGNNAYELNYSLNHGVASSIFWAWAPYVATGIIAPLAANYAYEVLKSRIGKPSMLTESKTSHWYSPITNPVSTAWNWAKGTRKPDRPIFKPDLRARLDDVTAATKNIVKNQGDLEWTLLFGPPGGGKTMFGRQIAEESGMDFYLLSAAELSVFISQKTHIYELNKFLNYIERSRRPVVLFLDEFDSIGTNRSRLDQAHLEILSTLLSRTGAASKKIMLVAATNREEVLDPAILSRFTHKIAIELPDDEERVRILDQYIKKFFKKDEINQFFPEHRVKEIAQKIEGFSGRTIYLMLNSIYNKKAAMKDGKLTEEAIHRKIGEFIQQERIVLKEKQA